MEELLMSSFYLCNSAALQAGLSKMAFKVYSFLSMGANNETRSCFHSKATIAKQCKISLSSVVRATRELCKKGLLEIQKRFFGKGHQTSNLYILLDTQQLNLGSTASNKGLKETMPLVCGKSFNDPVAEPQTKFRLFKCNSTVFLADLSPNELKVYSYLSFRAGKNSQCKPSKKEIASDCGISVSTATRAIRQLSDSGLISVQPQTRLEVNGNNGTSVNLYELKEIITDVTGEQPSVYNRASDYKSILISLIASLFDVLTPILMSWVTPQRTMSRIKVTLKQRKEEFISKVAKRILLQKHKIFAGRHICLAKSDDG
jgi:DNA-binding MarR family transcriptional regulator